MVYPKLDFPKLKLRPYFYSNFVTTVDGKAQVLKNSKKYWPLGSKLDFQTLQDLRESADCLIHGKTTAIENPTLQSLGKLKSPPKLYIVLSNHPGNELVECLENPPKGIKTIIVTNEEAVIPKELLTHVIVIQLGRESVDLKRLSEFLKKEGIKKALVEGGPTLMGPFFEEDLIDEIFLTIAPKIVGGKLGETLTMVEGGLLSPEKVKKLELISSKAIESELYLRYKVLH